MHDDSPPPIELRSAKWFRGDDEMALVHRAAMASSGIELADPGRAPIIGIANSASELNPCNLPLSALVPAVKEGVAAGGGVGVEFPTISLGEDLMKPSAMLYRNLLAIEIEETIRSYPLDGVVVLANCDKSVPGALMGALSANLPTVLVTGGSRRPATFQGKRIGTGTDLWRLSELRRAGLLSDEEWSELEGCLGCATGACNTMGTASTMAVLSEALGLMVAYSSTIPTGDQRGLASARAAGRAAARCASAGVTPSTILTKSAFSNAGKVLHAVGGSTNAVIHLLALARRAGVDMTLDDIGDLGMNIPLLADVEPSGRGLMPDFDAAGGVPSLLKELAPKLDLSARTVEGKTIGEIVEKAEPCSGAIRAAGHPLKANGAIRVVKGTLAPDGAVVKVAAASPHLLRHSGPAVVFNSYQDMMSRIDDPALEVGPESVLVLRGCGPVGVPGMPEWGMIPIPAKLVRAGIRDLVRVTDARMSGTSFGTVVLHVAPEAAAGGPLGLVRDGDMIALDTGKGRIDLLVAAEQLAGRQPFVAEQSRMHLRGWPALYKQHVLQAPQGCDLDFLTVRRPEEQVFVEPIIGRS